MASSAAIEDMLTIEPPPVCRIAAIPARQPRKTLSTLTEKICFQSANRVSSGLTRSAAPAMPALLTRMLTGPARSLAFCSTSWPLVLAGDVLVHEHGPEVGRGLIAEFPLPVGDDDPRALGGQPSRDRLAQAGRAAGDQRRPAVQSPHQISPRRGQWKIEPPSTLID